MKNIKFPICAASLFILMSCVDLNLNPLSEGSSENWYSSQAEIEMSLNDFYRKEFFPIDDMMWGDDVTARNSTSAINNGTLTSEDWTIASRWENYYKGIARALRIIKNMDRARAMGVSEMILLNMKERLISIWDMLTACWHFIGGMQFWIKRA